MSGLLRGFGFGAPKLRTGFGATATSLPVTTPPPPPGTNYAPLLLLLLEDA